MIISLIAAMDKNRLIGADNAMPWYLPADFKYFKEITMGKPIIMGRKTFESIGKPLPGRRNIVISRCGFSAQGVTSVGSIGSALKAVSNVEEVMIIGGANIYQQMIDKADRMYLTHVNAVCEGDTWFPAFDESRWNTVEEKSVVADEKNNYSFKIIKYERM